MRFSLKNDYVYFTLGNVPYNRPQPEKKIFFDDISQDEAILPSEETDIEIEPSEVTNLIHPSSNDKENQIDELLNKVYRAGPTRSLSYDSLLIEIKTPTQNNVLHIAAHNGNDKIVSLVVEHAPKLLSESNKNLESVLHIAARAGHISIVEKLLEAAKSNGKDLLEFVAQKNVKGNTMFHEAMLCRNKKRIGGDKIFKACELYKTGDSSSKWNEIAFVNVNNAKQSVLYLAVDSEDKEAVRVIMENCPDNVTPKGLSPVVAAIMKKNQGII